MYITSSMGFMIDNNLLAGLRVLGFIVDTHGVDVVAYKSTRAGVYVLPRSPQDPNCP